MSSGRVLMMTFTGLSDSVILEHQSCKRIVVLIAGMDGSVILSKK